MLAKSVTRAGIVVTTTYQKSGIEIVYPENWTLVESESDQLGTDFVGERQPKQISIQSPGSGVWDLYVFDKADDLSKRVQEFLTALQSQYDTFESEPLEVEIGDKKLVGYEAHFYCLDFLIKAHLLMLPGDVPKLISYQAESREFDSSELVFKAITLSLISNLRWVD